MTEYKLTFKWTDELIQTNEVIIKADSKEMAEAELRELLEDGGYEDIGKENHKKYLNLGAGSSFPDIISVEESK